MKKIFVFATIALVALAASCNKEKLNSEEAIITPVSITAISENSTKATINSSDEVIWKDGDLIGVRVYKGTAYNGKDGGSQFTAADWTFNITAGQNTTVGTFSNSGLDQWHHWSYAAFYPVYSNYVDNNDGKVKFEFKTSYDNYSSGLVLTPLVANLNTNNSLEERPTVFSFKQVAGTILVTIKNVPVAANKFSLALSGKAITGWGSIDPTTAGSGEISSVNGTAGDPVYFSFPRPTSSVNTMEFYVPVPTMTSTPALTVNLYINDDVLWSKTSTKTQPAIGRGTLLDMSAVTISDNGTSEWSLIGDAFDGWGTDVALTKIKGSDWVYILNRAVNAKSAFKFRKNGKWANEGGEEAGYNDSSYGVESNTRTEFNGSNNVGKVNGGAGNYDIFFNTSTKIGYFFKR